MTGIERASAERGGRFRSVDETVGGLVGLQQDHHAAAQLRVLSTRLVEIGTPFAGSAVFNRVQEDAFDLSGLDLHLGPPLLALAILQCEKVARFVPRL